MRQPVTRFLDEVIGYAHLDRLLKSGVSRVVNSQYQNARATITEALSDSFLSTLYHQAEKSGFKHPVLPNIVPILQREGLKEERAIIVHPLSKTPEEFGYWEHEVDLPRQESLDLSFENATHELKPLWGAFTSKEDTFDAESPYRLFRYAQERAADEGEDAQTILAAEKPGVLVAQLRGPGYRMTFTERGRQAFVYVALTEAQATHYNGLVGEYKRQVGKMVKARQAEWLEQNPVDAKSQRHIDLVIRNSEPEEPYKDPKDIPLQ